MIDWLTLRYPLEGLNPALRERLNESMLYVTCCDADGVPRWRKAAIDFDKLRSDTPGLMWQLQGDGKQYYLAIGGSPASIEHGVNVFGSGDICHCAGVLVRHARKCLQAVLPDAERWQIRRVDVTHNYLLPTAAAVKEALRMLMRTEGGRRKPCALGGDSVYYNPSSDLSKGKAYHKGPQLDYLNRKGKTAVTEETIRLCNRILRLELTKGARFWRRREEANEVHWSDLTESDLDRMHEDFFGRFFGSMEVADMTDLLSRLENVAPTPGQALAAHRTWAVIRAVKFDQARASMPKATWHRHLKLLRAAGLSDADFCEGDIVSFRRHTLDIGAPVRTWSELLKMAA